MSTLNFRKMFCPDPSYTLVEGDLARAESQIVAWESGDPDLKHIFSSGIDVHKENAEFIYAPLPSNNYRRDRAKHCIYAIQNGGKERRLGELLKDASKGRRFYNYWTGRFPSIPQWHERLMDQVRSSHAIRNIWGYKNHWFDRIEPSIIGDLVPWITQSTIGIAINRALVSIDQAQRKGFDIQLLMQVHDSLIMQVPTAQFDNLFPIIKQAMHVTIPYADPLIIPVDFKASTISWGDATKIK